MKRFLSFAIILILSVLSVHVGLGNSYESAIGRLFSLGRYKGVSAGGWVSDGAIFRFHELSSRGNRLELPVIGGRPPGSGEARLSVSVCNGEPTELLAVPDSQLAISLNGSCEPRVVSINLLNPFSPPGDSGRKLGMRVGPGKVISRVGGPIFSFNALSQPLLAVLSLTLLVWLVGGGIFSLLIPPISGILLANADYFSRTQLYWLWVVALGVAAGIFIARRLSDTEWLKTVYSDGLQSRFSGIAKILLFAALVVAVLLRFHNLTFGLPTNYHPDEVPKVNAIMGMVAAGDLNPRYFLHPSLLLYLTYFTNTIIHYVGTELDFRTSAFLAGRIVSATAGSASILLVYLIGRRLYSPMTGAISALLLAVFPLHVTCSRYLKEDALLTFLLLAAILVVIKACESGKKGYIYLAAIIAGLSASTKYSGLLTAGVVAAAPFLRSKSIVPDREFLKTSCLALILVPIAFVIGTPYSILTPTKFRSDFGFEQRHMLRGHTQSIDAWSQFWMYHFSKSLVPGMTTLSAVLGVIGVGVLLWRRKIEDLAIVAAVLVFYLPSEWVKAKPAPQPERYVFPCLPFLAIAIGELMRLVGSKRRQVIAIVATLIVWGSSADRSFKLAHEMDYDTRTQVSDWMNQNAPVGAKVYIDWRPYGPTIDKSRFNVEEVLRANIESKLDIDALKSSGKDYLILSSLFYDRYFNDPYGQSVPKARIRTVFTKIPIIKEFTAPSGTYGFHNPRLTLFSLKAEDIAAFEAELSKKNNSIGEYSPNEPKTGFTSWAPPGV